MPTLDFKACFADDVETGRKRCTIRAKRKRPIKVGHFLHLYTAQRRVGGGRVLGGVNCTEVQEIHIGPITPVAGGHILPISLDGRALDHAERARLAQDDGFASVVEMAVFFESTHGLPFEGVLIRW